MFSSLLSDSFLLSVLYALVQKKRKVAGNEDSQPQISSGGLELLAAYDSDEESGNTGDGEEKVLILIYLQLVL